RKKRILLLAGGGSTEHEISLISAQYLKKLLSQDPQIQLYEVEIEKDLKWKYQGKACNLTLGRMLEIEGQAPVAMNAAIPCLHGFPGETGDVQSFFELMKLPYIGCN